MDKQVIEKAKQYAEQEKTSLSALIEGFLCNLTREHGEIEISPTVKSISGVLKGKVSEDWKLDRADYLEKKYK